MYWPYHDGHHLLKGVDLAELFAEYDAERSFNMIDHIIIEDSMSDQQNEGAIVRTRAVLDKAYGRIRRNGINDIDSGDFDDSAGSIPTYAEQTEDGYVGFEAPLG